MTGISRKILFVCIHNSARSQMAEAFLNKYGEGRYIAESAGLEPGKMNPNVVAVMQEVGIDLSHKKTQGVFDLYRKEKQYDAVITVCDGASAKKCPVFPGLGKKMVWSFEDPSSIKGTQDEILANTRQVRDQIERSVRDFIAKSSVINYWM